MKKRGKFITLEGLDGAGKSTQAHLLAGWLRDERRLQVLETREPGGTETGEELRRLLFAGGRLDAVSETLLMFAARREHLRQKIAPALKAGAWVVCDRFTDSTFAYQGGGRGVSPALIDALAAHVQEGLAPDLTLYFEAPAATAAAPLLTSEAFENEDAAFFRRVQKAYEKHAAQNPRRIAVIRREKNGARRGIDDIAAEARDIAQRLFARAAPPRRRR